MRYSLYRNRKTRSLLSRNEIEMKYGISISGPIHWAISLGKIPDDIVQRIQSALSVFRVDAELFDDQHLRGPAKQAELIVKLGYWLAMNQLTEKEFRIWADCIPPEDNAGWDVDLLPAAPGSQMRPVLRLGPLGTQSEAGLVQETPWIAAFPP